jgi:hypothetical protein
MGIIKMFHPVARVARGLANKTQLFVSLLSQGNFYSIRRALIWPEGDYKRTMLRRVQRVYNYAYLVETGTYQGETALALRGEFEHIWTIELDDKLFLSASSRLKPYPNITCMQGDSKDVLPRLVPHLDKPTTFFLDAHYSGPGTALGETLSPLLLELQAISQSKLKDHIIIIDDISDFSAAENNIPLSSVIKSLEGINRNYKFYADYDMLFCLPFEKQHREFWREIAPPVVIR